MVDANKKFMQIRSVEKFKMFVEAVKKHNVDSMCTSNMQILSNEQFPVSRNKGQRTKLMNLVHNIQKQWILKKKGEASSDSDAFMEFVFEQIKNFKGNNSVLTEKWPPLLPKTSMKHLRIVFGITEQASNREDFGLTASDKANSIYDYNKSYYDNLLVVIINTHLNAKLFLC